MSKTIRLIYPQWQGGIISDWIKELNPEDSSRGYYIGAKLLSILAPQNDNHETIEVPISLDIKNREIKNGIMDYEVIAWQTKSALEILEAENADKILTLGGECSVSVPPFSYLAHKYRGDVAVVWIDAHPDINLPKDRILNKEIDAKSSILSHLEGDSYEDYHAMALASCCGLVEGIATLLPTHFSPRDSILVGVREFEGKKCRQEELDIAHLSVADSKDSVKLLEWLKARGKNRVFVHFDLDVLDDIRYTSELDTMFVDGVGPAGLKLVLEDNVYKTIL